MGAGGDFADMLMEIAASSIPFSAYAYAAIIFVSVVFSLSCDVVRSQAFIVSLGVLLIIISFVAGIGAISLFGRKLNIVQLWCLPFLLVGVGVDDLYVITTALDQNQDYKSAMAYAQCLQDVILPITMTTSINFILFAQMIFSEVAAVYETGILACTAIVIMYIMMVTCIPAILAMDRRRQARSRADCLCCIKVKTKDRTKLVPVWAYRTIYRPLLQTIVGKTIILVITLAMVCCSAYGSSNYKVGVDIEDLFLKGTPLHHWALYRMKYFPLFRMIIAFGEEEYIDPGVQLRMLMTPSIMER